MTKFYKFISSQGKVAYIDPSAVMAIQDYADEHPTEGSRCVVLFNESSKLTLNCSADYVMAKFVGLQETELKTRSQKRGLDL